MPSSFILRLMFAGLLVSSSLSVGCVTKPTMQLYSAGVRGAATDGVLLNITMSVRNDNSFDVMVRNVTTEVTLADRHRLPAVVFSPNVWLPADKATLVTVPVVIPWGSIAGIVATTVTTPRIRYRAVGFADITATRALEIDVNEYKLDEDGTFLRSELIAAAGNGLPGVQIQAQRAEL